MTHNQNLSEETMLLYSLQENFYMNTLILMTLATLVTLIWCLPSYAINPVAPVITDHRATPFRATGPLRLLKPLAITPSDRFRDYLLRLVINRSYHAARLPG
jgi:hypothetical protein